MLCVLILASFVLLADSEWGGKYSRYNNFQNFNGNFVPNNENQLERPERHRYYTLDTFDHGYAQDSQYSDVQGMLENIPGMFMKNQSKHFLSERDLQKSSNLRDAINAVCGNYNSFVHFNNIRVCKKVKHDNLNKNKPPKNSVTSPTLAETTTETLKEVDCTASQTVACNQSQELASRTALNLNNSLQAELKLNNLRKLNADSKISCQTYPSVVNCRSTKEQVMESSTTSANSKVNTTAKFCLFNWLKEDKRTKLNYTSSASTASLNVKTSSFNRNYSQLSLVRPEKNKIIKKLGIIPNAMLAGAKTKKIDTTTRNSNKITKNPSQGKRFLLYNSKSDKTNKFGNKESINNDSQLFPSAISNFSDFVTIGCIFNAINSTDPMDIVQNILSKLSKSPEFRKWNQMTTQISNRKITTELINRNRVLTISDSSIECTSTCPVENTDYLKSPLLQSSESETKKSECRLTMPNISKFRVSTKPTTFKPMIRLSCRSTTKCPQMLTTLKTFQVTNTSLKANHFTNAVYFPLFDGSGLFPYSETQSVRDYVTYMSERAATVNHKSTLARWYLETNMTHVTHKQSMVASLELIYFQRTLNKYLEPLAKEKIQDPMLTREIKLLYSPGMSILPDIKIAEFEEILFAMNTIYVTASVTKWNNPQVRYRRGDIIKSMQKSKSPEELKHYWVEWRSATGLKLKSLFEQYVELLNLTAVSNGFSDAGEMWTRDYETEDFMQLVGCHWEEIRPLYQELHAYVRAKLNKFYGEVAVKCNHSPIPTHLTGDLWGQSWKNLYAITEPFPRANCSFYPDLKARGFSKSKMISQAEHFYLSLGFPPLSELFWKHSVLTKVNPEMNCIPSSWDMHDGRDFRIKMCFNGTVEDCFSLYHELAYIEYFKEYRNLSFPFRRGPNPAFHEGIAGALMLAIQSPAYLNKMGMLKIPPTKEADINFLFNMALDKLAFLPYSYIVDLWRFRVFTGEIKPQDYNDKWWKMRMQYQGIMPPIKRTVEDFDPGSVFHIATNKPYLQKFISTILQFQFFEALCRKSGKVSDKLPLHKCDLYNSPAAGNHLRSVMQMGASRHWRVAMKALTDSRQINSRALLEYFSPLYDWLKKENLRTGQRVGWSDHLEMA